MNELRALQSVDLSHNQLSSIGEHFERMISLHTLDLSGNESIDPDNLPTRTRRLHEKVIRESPLLKTSLTPFLLSPFPLSLDSQQQLLKSKSERRALVKRALGIRHQVLMKEQETIMELQERSGDYP
jgi:Leucine-rich repeat (LRR) protein